MSTEGKRIFISGGAGFIGCALIERLVESNEIVVFDTFERDMLHQYSLDAHPNVRIARGDVLDEDGVGAAMAGCDLVLHLAAVAGIDTVVKSPTRTIMVNTIGTANVLRAALEHDCERVVVFSTSEVFGDQAFRSGEADRSVIGALGEARWSYAISKLAAEHLAHAYFKDFGLRTVVIRPFNVYGPGQVGDGALRTFVERAIRDEEIEIHGDGTQIRAWCYIEDVVRAVLATLESPAAVGESFNVGNSRAVLTIYGLANTVVRITRSSSPIVFANRSYADIELRIPNVDKARDVLGFEAEVDLDRGIELTAGWYRNRLLSDPPAVPSAD